MPRKIKIAAVGGLVLGLYLGLCLPAVKGQVGDEIPAQPRHARHAVRIPRGAANDQPPAVATAAAEQELPADDNQFAAAYGATNRPLDENFRAKSKGDAVSIAGAAQPLKKLNGPGKSSDSPGNLEQKMERLVESEVDAFWTQVLRVWNFVVTTSDGENITVGKIVIGLFLFVLGYFAAKWISHRLGTRVLHRMGLHPSAASPIQKISFYALLATFTFFSLNFLKVPLTAFTFLGGALAIGIGFGSQNIMNNFISGLILLAERPIRVGDVIQIEGQTGKVSEIDARSTRIVTGNNQEVIIPNSSFLQSNVINWTLSNDVIGTKVTVGVAYGSPAREVAKLLLQAADEHASVLKKPGPGVAFTDFSDHAMVFDLNFWIKMSVTDRSAVESDLRFRIDELFAEHSIVIAYQQRDVHLNLLRPVEVKLTQPLLQQPYPRDARSAAA